MTMTTLSIIAASVIVTLSPLTPHGQDQAGKQFTKAFITAVMERVCDWQLRHPVPINDRNDNDWARAAFYDGVMATYRTTKEDRFLDAAIAWSNACDWKPAQRPRNADDQARCQTFLEIYEIKKDASMIVAIRSRYDSLIADPKPGREDWWWCDALFMAPPVLARLAAATGDARYLEYLNRMFWDTVRVSLRQG